MFSKSLKTKHLNEGNNLFHCLNLINDKTEKKETCLGVKFYIECKMKQILLFSVILTNFQYGLPQESLSLAIPTAEGFYAPDLSAPP